LEGGTIGTTEFREAGVTLAVTPHIAQDGTIAMVVNPRFSLLTGFSEPDNAPIIDRRETTTTVRLMDHQTIVLGGLRQRTRIADRSEIPLLGKIPYFGRMFRFRSFSSRESELLVFITPQIVHGHQDMSIRENCMGEFLQREIDQTPTSPVPYGIETLRMENRARADAIDRRLESKECEACEGQAYPIHSSLDSGHDISLPEIIRTGWTERSTRKETGPINMGLSIPPPLPR
ncbi:MAG: type II and III secretion system protein, partial [Planctomycetota bacterium]